MRLPRTIWPLLAVSVPILISVLPRKSAPELLRLQPGRLPLLHLTGKAETSLDLSNTCVTDGPYPRRRPERQA
jgi:hypothetical protein